MRCVFSLVAHSSTIDLSSHATGFGGLYGTKSKYGDMDITGDGAIEFFTNRIKITSKWPAPCVPEYVVGLAKKQKMDTVVDHANFAGTM
jgi:malonate-semialdehyde dehydrogenase (acetylating)/methylmalonate-semialdehyde dehydrogenase